MYIYIYILYIYVCSWICLLSFGWHKQKTQKDIHSRHFETTKGYKRVKYGTTPDSPWLAYSSIGLVSASRSVGWESYGIFNSKSTTSLSQQQNPGCFRKFPFISTVRHITNHHRFCRVKETLKCFQDELRTPQDLSGPGSILFAVYACFGPRKGGPKSLNRWVPKLDSLSPSPATEHESCGGKCSNRWKSQKKVMCGKTWSSLCLRSAISKNQKATGTQLGAPPPWHGWDFNFGAAPLVPLLEVSQLPSDGSRRLVCRDHPKGMTWNRQRCRCVSMPWQSTTGNTMDDDGHDGL